MTIFNIKILQILFMKKFLCLPAVFLMSLIMLSTISLAAGEVELSLDKSSLTIASGSTGSVILTVKNNQNTADVFSIATFPALNFFEASNGILGEIVNLTNNNLPVLSSSSQSVEIRFRVKECTPTTRVGFTISATSANTRTISDSKEFTLQTLGYIACIRTLVLDKDELNPDGTVVITTNIRNLVKYAITDNTLSVEISKDGRIVKSFEETVFLAAESSKDYSVSYKFDKYAEPGIYDVKAVLKDANGKVVDTKSTNLKINEVKNVVRLESERNYLLVRQITVEIKNGGNSPSEAFLYQKSMPSYVSLFFKPVTEAVQKTSSAGKTIYSWQVPPLMPGQIFVVEYRINFLNVWTIPLMAAVVLFAFHMNLYSVTVVKRYTHRGSLEKGKEISVSLEVTNKGYGEIKDVVLRDKVPDVARVEDEFETLKPTKKKIQHATELIWRIPSMKRHEVRILTYKIKPVVDIVGTLNLPEAHISFEGGFTTKRNIRYSNGVVVK